MRGGRKANAMLCDQVMNRNPKCLNQTDTVQAAAKLMRDANIGFVPVCGDGGKVIGTITDRDIVVKIAADNGALNKPLSAFMSPNVIACKAKDDLSRAEQLMETNRKSRIVCLDDGGKAVGVISLSDIAQHEDGGRTGQLLRSITQREVRAR
jgi:CBS domain-containing protein